MLNLPAGPHAAVWAVLVAALKADEALSLADIALDFPDGDVDGVRDLDSYPNPAAVAFTPGVGGGRWFDEASAVSELRVEVEVSLAVPDAADMLNLQNALLTTLNTISGTFRQTLVDADANTGLILFDTPFRPVDRGKNGRLRAKGGFSLEVLRTLG